MAARDIRKEELEALLQKEKPVLVDFWAPWCGYCRRIGPVYDQIAEQYQDEVAVVTINIDQEEALSDALGIEIIPTLVWFDHGQKVAQVVNPGSKAQIEAFIKDQLHK